MGGPGTSQQTGGRRVSTSSSEDGETDFASLLHQLDILRSALAGQHLLEIQQERERYSASPPGFCQTCAQSHSGSGFLGAERFLSGGGGGGAAAATPSPLCVERPQETQSRLLTPSKIAQRLTLAQATRDRLGDDGMEAVSEVVSDLDRDSEDEDEGKKTGPGGTTIESCSQSRDSEQPDAAEPDSSFPSNRDSHRARFLLLDQWRAHKKEEKGVIDFLKALEPSLLTDDFDHLTIRDTKGGPSSKPLLPLSPYSKIHSTHMAVCFLLVTVDTFVIPYDASFARGRFDILGEAGEYVLASLWTLDLILSFITGRFEGGQLIMRMQSVCIQYLMTWFAMDAFLSLLRWWLLVGGSSVEYLEDLGWELRYLRLLQLARLVRFRHWWYIIEDLLLDAPGGVVLQGLIKLVAVSAACMHGIACGWYAVGRASTSPGWVSVYGDEQHLSLYLDSLHWATTQFHGSHDMSPSTEKETVFSIVALFICYALFASGIGSLTQLLMHVRNLQRERLQGQCRHFLSTKAVPGQLVARVDTALRQRGDTDATQLYAELWGLIDELPLRLRTDVAQAIKMPVFATHRFFDVMCNTGAGSRAVRQLCVEAAKLVMFRAGEAVFTAMYKCSHMIIVESGRLHYSKVSAGQHGLSSSRLGKPRLSRGHAFEVQEQSCLPGLSMCEPALWTKWQFCGDAVATRPSTVLALDSAIFGGVVGQFGGQVGHYASAYAKAFLKELNVVPHPELSDLTSFDLNPAQLLSSKPWKTGEDEHYIFISHFKQESGTEAALLLDTLEKTISEDTSNPAADFDSPFFLDSEVLSDLSSLPKHVMNSHNLVILLTNKVFTRRWCLEELVLAMRAGTYIIPCEIQRPGMQYDYPDAAFYKQFAAGQIVSAEDTRLLSEQGISLQDCEDAIRYVSRLISVTFSPHKSLKIRTAEAASLLERCGMRDLEAAGVSSTTRKRLGNRSQRSERSFRLVGHEITLRSNAALEQGAGESQSRISSSNLATVREAFRGARSVSSPPILDFDGGSDGV